jgi:hypothetical protein
MYSHGKSGRIGIELARALWSLRCHKTLTKLKFRHPVFDGMRNSIANQGPVGEVNGCLPYRPGESKSKSALVTGILCPLPVTLSADHCSKRRPIASRPSETRSISKQGET